MGKEEIKLSLTCRWDEYENSKQCTRKKYLLELISEFTEVAEYKIKIQKLLAFHYFSISLRKGERKNSSLSNNRYHNYFRIKLTRKVRLLYEEN